MDDQRTDRKSGRSISKYLFAVLLEAIVLPIGFVVSYALAERFGPTTWHAPTVAVVGAIVIVIASAILFEYVLRRKTLKSHT